MIDSLVKPIGEPRDRLFVFHPHTHDGFYNIYPLDDAKGGLENVFCDLLVFNPLLPSVFLDHDIIFFF